MNSPASEISITLKRSPFEETELGGPVLRLTLGAHAKASDVRAVVERARAQQACLVFTRLPSSDRKNASALKEAGFREIEQLITFRRAILPLPEYDQVIDLARAEDFTACIEIGRRAFTTDRYHADPEIPDAVADTLKARWVENSLAGRADTALVARDESGGVVGFNLIMNTSDGPSIDLIAVAENQRGRGIGRALVAAALAHYQGQAEAMLVGTQSRNTASMALYPALGFDRIAEQTTFHWTP